MAYTNSSLVSYKRLSPNYNTRNKPISKITVHHMAGNLSVEACGNVFAPTSRQASSNYGIGSDGRIGMYVEEKNRSWCSSSPENDHQAITIEVANDEIGGNWHVSDKAMESLIKLCVDICKRNGIAKLNFTGDKNGNLTAHKYFANTACVPTSTEVLTRNGWKTLKDIQVGEEIACADLDNLNITFEQVYSKVPVKRQDTYTNNGLTATKDHRIVYRSQYGKMWKIDEYKNLLSKQYYIPLAGVSHFDGMPISDEMLRFMVAVQADAHYMYERLEDNSKSYYGIEFHLKKERKIKSLEGLLRKLDLQFSKGERKDGSVAIRVYNQNGINIAIDICEKYLTNKAFNWNWINLSPEQAKLFLDEIMLWDGCIAGKKYSSRVKINLDIVNAIAALNNVGSRVDGYDVCFRDTPYMTLNGETKRNGQTRKCNEALTEVTCVSVKTGIFLARQNGKTFIIGNCPGPYLYSKFPYIAEQVNKQLSVSTQPTKGTQATSFLNMTNDQIIAKVGPLFTEDQKTTGVLACVSMAQFILESAYGKSELAQNANNCFGMKRNLSGNNWAGSKWDGVSVYNKGTKEQYTNGNYISVNADFRKYACVEDSIADHSAYLIGAKKGTELRYNGLQGETDYKKAAQIIKDGGYATSLSYVTNLCKVIEQYGLTKYNANASETPKQPVSPAKVLYRVRKSWADATSQIGAYANLENAKKACKDGYHVYDEKGNAIYPVESPSVGVNFAVGDEVKLMQGATYIDGKAIPNWVINSKLYVREIRADGNIVFSTVKSGAITGVAAKKWFAKYSAFTPYLVKVEVGALNIRSGAGANYEKVGCITDGGVYTIVDESNGWGKLKSANFKSGVGWIALEYTKKV